MPTLDATTALERLGGVASPAAITALSSRRRLRTALAKGLVVRVSGRDLVALATTERDRATAVRHGGVLSHTSAAIALEWAVASVPGLPIITRPHHLAPPEQAPEDAELYTRRLPPGDVSGWHTSPLRTVLDCACDLPFGEALAVADSALRAGALGTESLVRGACGLRGPRADGVRRVAAYADGRAENPFESELRALCIEAGLDAVPQWEVRVQGLVLHPDLADPLRGVGVEAESWKHHGTKRKVWVRDLVRFNALTLAGWRVLRFTWEQVRFNKRYVLETLRAVITQAAT